MTLSRFLTRNHEQKSSSMSAGMQPPQIIVELVISDSRHATGGPVPLIWSNKPSAQDCICISA